MDIQDLSADDQKTVISIDSKCKEAVEFEDGTILELGYAPVYRRVFRMLGNMCLVVALTSPLGAVLITGYYQISYAGYWGLSW
ncbi:unnamed protein product [Penicillium crustosum]